MFDEILHCIISGLVVYTVVKIGTSIYDYFDYKKLEKQCKKDAEMLKKEYNYIKEMIKKPDELNNEFNKRRHEIAYNNKLKQVEAKIEELKKQNVHRIIAEQLAGCILVDIANCMVEGDRIQGKLDSLYSEINIF